jgi:hypothetical protein
MEVMRRPAEIAACRFAGISTFGMPFRVSRRPASAVMLVFMDWITALSSIGDLMT